MFQKLDCIHNQEGLWKGWERSTVGGGSTYPSRPINSRRFSSVQRQELQGIIRNRGAGKEKSWSCKVFDMMILCSGNTYAVSFLMIKIILVTGTLISYKNNVAGWESCTLLRDTWSLWWSWRDWTLIPFNNTTLCNNVKTVTMWKLSDYDSVICGREEETILSKDYQKMFFFFFWCFFSVYV